MGIKDINEYIELVCYNNGNNVNKITIELSVVNI